MGDESIAELTGATRVGIHRRPRRDTLRHRFPLRRGESLDGSLRIGARRPAARLGVLPEDVPGPARRMAEHLTLIVRAATAGPGGQPWVSALSAFSIHVLDYSGRAQRFSFAIDPLTRPVSVALQCTGPTRPRLHGW